MILLFYFMRYYLEFFNFHLGRLLQEISLEMESRMNNSNRNTSRKIHLYSGHDMSVGLILGFLDNFPETIDFGASVHLHLHFDERIGYTVKV